MEQSAAKPKKKMTRFSLTIGGFFLATTLLLFLALSAALGYLVCANLTRIPEVRSVPSEIRPVVCPTPAPPPRDLQALHLQKEVGDLRVQLTKQEDLIGRLKAAAVERENKIKQLENEATLGLELCK